MTKRTEINCGIDDLISRERLRAAFIGVVVGVFLGVGMAGAWIRALS